jgi:hypothetical protein
MTSNDPLQQQLRRADTAAGATPALRADLPARVRRLAKRRRRNRAADLGALSAAAAVAAGVILWATVWSDRDIAAPAPVITQISPTPTAAPNITQANTGSAPATTTVSDNDRDAARLAQIRFEIDWRLRAIKAVEEDERGRVRQDRLRAPDPLDAMQQNIDTVALVMVRQADRMAETINNREVAAAQYRRTVVLFPQSSWAETARQRLLALSAAPKS